MKILISKIGKILRMYSSDQDLCTFLKLRILKNIIQYLIKSFWLQRLKTNIQINIDTKKDLKLARSV